MNADEKRRTVLGGRPDATKRTIPLRIRVGVTADGNWSAFGRQNGEPSMSPTDIVAEDLEGHGPIVAWHWIGAMVPMPETEQGDVAGEVEQPCAGMPSDQKGAK